MQSPCPDDNALVAFVEGSLPPAHRDAVAAHIDGCPMCRALAVEAVEPELETTELYGAPYGTTRAAAVPPPARGESLDRFIVLGTLGSGGLGDVFLAYDPKLDRRVAVKLLRSPGTTPELVDQMHRRLGREARALAKLAHPNVVHVYDVGRDGDRVFIAMEYVPGGTLGPWLAQRGRTWSQVRDLMVMAGEGLVAAHAQGLVHRDFKPGNVLIGGDGRPRVVDFGLAREPPRSADAQTLSEPTVDATGPLTMSGTVMGTPAYMAPEQHYAGAVDARADQFAFCVTLFEGLYRRRPFAGATVMALELAKRRNSIIEPPPGLRPPTWLRRVVERGLAAEPSARFASMSALLEALTQDARRERRRRIAWGIGTVAILAGVAVGGTIWSRTPSAQTLASIDRLQAEAQEAAARRHYVFPSADAPSEPTAYQHVRALEALPDGSGRADGVAAKLRSSLAEELTELGDTYFDREGGRPFALEYYASALVFDPDNVHASQRAQLPAWALADLGRRAAVGEFSSLELAVTEPLRVLAHDDPTRQEAEVQALLGPESELPATTKAALAVVARGRPARRRRPDAAPSKAVPTGAAPLEVVGVAPSAQPVPPVAPLPAPTIAGQAVLEVGPTGTPQGRPPTAEQVARTAQRAAEAGAAAREEAAREAAAGQAHLDGLRFDEAEAAFHRALAADRNHVPALRGLAELQFEQGRHRQGLQFARRVVALRPRSADDRIQLGDMYFRVLRYDQARPHYERARDLGHRDAAGRLAQLRAKLGEP